MTRSYTLDNWDGHLSNFESHKLPQTVRAEALSLPLESSRSPVSATQRPVLFSSNSRESVVEESLNCGRSKSHHSADGASNKSANDSIPHAYEKTRLFDTSDVSDSVISNRIYKFVSPNRLSQQDLTSDIVTDALDPLSHLTRDSEALSYLVSRNGTRFSGFPETFVPSPALTVQTISTDTDAQGEEEDDDVIIVDHVQTSFPPQNKTVDDEDAPSNTSYDSLFTPPPSESASTSETPPPFHWKKSRSRIVSSPAPRKMRTVATHVLVPSLSKPKSEYVRMSSLVNLARRPPHKTAQEGLMDVLNTVWQNNESRDWLGEHGDGEGEGKRKKRKRKHKAQEGVTHSIVGSSEPSRFEGESVVYTNRTPAVIYLVEEKTGPAETAVIDLTLDDDDDEEKALIPLSAPAQDIAEVGEVTSPARQPACGETQIRIGVVHSISCRTLLDNTRFLRCASADIVHTTDPCKGFVVMDSLPPLRRRALLDNNLEESSSVDDEFSLGSPVVTEFDQETIDEDYDDDPGYDVIELLDSSSESPVPKHVRSPRTYPAPSQPLACPPKIDLAARFRKKTTSAARRTSSVLTPSARKGAPVQLTSSSPASSSRNEPVDDDVYDPHTPLVPSAKALGKRKAVDSPLQPIQIRPDVQPLFPSSRPSVTTLESLPTCPTTDTFDLYINYSSPPLNRSMTLTSDNPTSYLGIGDPYPCPNPHSNLTLSSTVDHHPPFSSADPPPLTSLLYDYTGTSNDIDRLTTSVLDYPPQSEINFLPVWSPELESCFSYDNGTVNPSLLGGEPLGMSEHPESYFPDVGNEVFNTEKEVENLAIRNMSTSLASPRTSSKSESVDIHREADSGTIFVRRPQPTDTSISDKPKPPRRRVKRSMPDMIPSSILSLSFSSESEEETDNDDKPRRRSIKRHVRPTPAKPPSRTDSRPTVARKAAAILPAGLDVGGPKVMIGGQLWPTQDEAAYCHQCRNKTLALKLECRQCSKAFCVRCLTLRYPDEPRALQMKEAGCPMCLEYCNCTQCCKKRGIEYISTKDALAGGVASRAQLATRGSSRLPSSTVASSFPSPAPHQVIPSLSPSSSPRFPPSLLNVTGGVYWGVVYAADGSRIGAGFIPAKRDDKKPTPAGSEPVSETDNIQPRKKKRRVYVGKIHPSWQFDYAVKKCVLDPVPPPKRVHQSRRPRKYVGNKAFLFYRNEKMAKELADLSPLSSLEEDWDEEDEKMTVVEEEGDTIGIVGEDGRRSRESSKDGSVVSLKSLSDRDIMRAIGLGLHACGIQLAG